MFSIELVASERLSFTGKLRRLTVSISSSPSSMLAATPGASWSSRRARLATADRLYRHRRAPKPAQAPGVPMHAAAWAARACRVGRWRGGIRCEGITVAGGFRHVPMSQSRPLLRLQRPLIEPYVTFSVIRSPAAFPRRHSALVHNASLQNIETRLLPEGAGRSPERPMPALIFIPQPASELVADIFVDQPEVPSGVEPGEVRAPAP
jgi:hypothetical protein